MPPGSDSIKIISGKAAGDTVKKYLVLKQGAAFLIIFKEEKTLAREDGRQSPVASKTTSCCIQASMFHTSCPGFQPCLMRRFSNKLTEEAKWVKNYRKAMRDTCIWLKDGCCFTRRWRNLYESTKPSNCPIRFIS